MKKLPLRKCIVTNTMLPKSELLRIVKTPDGLIIYDPTGRANGHGAYLGKDITVISLAQKKHLLDKVFSTHVEDSFYEELKKKI